MYIIFESSLYKNVELSKHIQEYLDEFGYEYEVINLVKLDVTMYDSYKEEHDGIPKKIQELAKKMQSANGYIFVSPEYNYCIPPVQINVIAWLSRIGDDFRKLFINKYIQLASHSGVGGHDACNAMRIQFSRLGAIVLPREIISTYQKEVDLQSAKRIIKQFTDVSSK